MAGFCGQKKTRKKTSFYTLHLPVKKEWLQHLAFFAAFYVAIFFALTYFKKEFCT
jgi:hypothetical protein